MPNKNSYKPSWARFQQDMHDEDPDKSEKAAVAFMEERNKEVTNSQKARSYEEGRAKEWQKNKHEFSKNAQKSKDPSIKTLEKIKQAGEFEEVIPAPGFLLVEPITQKSQHGYYVPKTADAAPNTGIVIEAGLSLDFDGKVFRAPFVEKDDKILFRKFAGIDMKVNNKQCKFLAFGDVLAKVK